MKQSKLKVQIRKDTGKAAARRLRARGMIPGIVYGQGREPIMITIPNYDFTSMISRAGSTSILIDLEVEGSETRKTMIKEIQSDPVNSKLVSVDFLAISMDRPITTSIPIRLTGTPEGVKSQGGILEFLHRDVEISCLPGDMPDFVELDVTSLKIGESLHFADISGEKFTVLSNPKEPIAIVVAPSITKEAAPAVAEAEAVEGAAEAPAAEEEPKEPEVIREKKEKKEKEKEE